MMQYISLGQRIYRNKRLSSYRRMLVFVVRCLMNDRKMKNFIHFFRDNHLWGDIAISHPYVFEQVTRSVFYRNSTFVERLTLMKEHCAFFEEQLTPEALRSIYLGRGLTLWSEEYQGKSLELSLRFGDVHKKEGMLAVVLTLDAKTIYQIMFWVTRNAYGEPSIWVGALQGSVGGLAVNRELTKQFFGYRPKNLILYALRCIAGCLPVTHIYAVSDYGFYANNHIRLDRKLKISLDEFWCETGGGESADRRFFELPMMEPRKTLAEVESHKRNLYRKRFQLLDAICAEVEQAMAAAQKAEELPCSIFSMPMVKPMMKFQ